MKTRLSVVLAVGVTATYASLATPTAAAAKCGPNEVWVKSQTVLDNDGVAAGQKGYCAPRPGGKKPPKKGKQGSGNDQPVKANPYEYAYAYACGSIAVATLRPGQISGEPCDVAAIACEFQDAQSGAQRLNVYRRLKSGGPWEMSGTSCGPSDLPEGAAAPPPIPTLAQIQDAFTKLPFAKPRVNIQPEGDVTLVNLPTYFEAEWPKDRLGPGDVSKPVQLLSWSIEFKINPAEYNFTFGDGTKSGPTTDLGGPYPDGKIRHTYKQPNASAEVKVDATLSGAYRVNSGSTWIPLNEVADLQDEPVVNLEVREAKSRLYNY